MESIPSSEGGGSMCSLRSAGSFNRTSGGSGQRQGRNKSLRDLKSSPIYEEEHPSSDYGELRKQSPSRKLPSAVVDSSKSLAVTSSEAT